MIARATRSSRRLLREGEREDHMTDKGSAIQSTPAAAASPPQAARDAQGWRSVRILGSRIHLIDLDTVLATMDQWIAQRDGRCRQIVVTGYHGIWEGSKHEEFRQLLNGADMWIPDGIAPVFVARSRGYKNVRRIPGAELLAAFCERGSQRGYSSFFYGDTDPTLDALKAQLEKRFPGHRVAGTFSPPFRKLTPEEDEEHVRMINDAKPDVLWVGLGLPKQDRWIYEHRHRLNVPIAVGVGAAFAFVGGTIKRAPRWIGNCGLEWAYRLITEPRKCWRRSLVEGPKFIATVLEESVCDRLLGAAQPPIADLELTDEELMEIFEGVSPTPAGAARL
jgi:N-acetylglucosaminyldiphosphoundecaprenol N-acetyl-beta-D-mannosaminyltransferase